jgi:hypothetical protein
MAENASWSLNQAPKVHSRQATEFLRPVEIIFLPEWSDMDRHRVRHCGNAKRADTDRDARRISSQAFGFVGSQKHKNMSHRRGGSYAFTI